MLHQGPNTRFLFFAAISFFLFAGLFSKTFSQTAEYTGAIFVFKGNVTLNGKPDEGVDMELKKDGLTFKKISSETDGRYYFRMKVSTTNKKNEFVLYLTQPGTLPDTFTINTYIPQQEFNANIQPSYPLELTIDLHPTAYKDSAKERLPRKIYWDHILHEFVLEKPDPVLRKKYLEEKKRKAEEELKKKKEAEEARLKAMEDSLKAAADAKLKADQEAQRLADQKAKEKADRLARERLEAARRAQQMQHIQDSINDTDTLSILSEKRTNASGYIDQNAFDATGIYSINLARQALNAYKLKMNREKAANLSAKYETNNTLTSLLDVVDENDKTNKQIKKQ